MRKASSSTVTVARTPAAHPAVAPLAATRRGGQPVQRVLIGEHGGGQGQPDQAQQPADGVPGKAADDQLAGGHAHSDRDGQDVAPVRQCLAS